MIRLAEQIFQLLSFGGEDRISRWVGGISGTIGGWIKLMASAEFDWGFFITKTIIYAVIIAFSSYTVTFFLGKFYKWCFAKWQKKHTKK